MIETAYERGWATLQNGELLKAAEGDGFDLLVTTDKNLKYQQKVEGRTIGIDVLLSTSWPKIQAQASAVAACIDGAQRGAYVEFPL